MDSIWSPASGQFSLLAGRPGSYKTATSWTIGCNLALQGKRILWANLEPSMAQMLEAFIARKARIPRKMLGPHGQALDVEQLARLTVAMEEFKRLPMIFHFLDNDVHSLIARARKVKYDCLFVDYLQLLNAKGTRTPPERIEAVSHALRDYAHNDNVMVVALVQMNRAMEREGEDERLPRLSDLAGSAALEADADIVTFLFDVKRRGDWSNLTAYVGKNRYGPADVFVPLMANGAMCDVHEVEESVPVDRNEHENMERERYP